MGSVCRNMVFGLSVLAGMILLAGSMSAQEKHSVSDAQNLISKQSLKKNIEALTDPALRGRESGTEDIKRGLGVITDAFYDGGVSMKGDSYLYGFWYWKGNERALGINVIGIIPADPSVVSPKTLVLGAHYDGLGVLGGRVYPGADNNASGVAALTEVGKALGRLASEGIYPSCNICLVAFDAKLQDCLGSSRFLSEQTGNLAPVSLMINLDQIGTTLAPPKEAETGGLLPKDYLLFLGMDNVEDTVKKAFVEANDSEKPIVLDFTCYGNKQVHDMLYEMGDQTSFRDAGIPAIVLTSGVHKYTNKISDNAGIINFNALTERCKLIFRAIYKLAYRQQQD